MFPKVGDIVKLNPDFLKVWFRRGNRYFEKDIWEERLTVTEVQDLEKHNFLILFESKNYDYYLLILSNGESGLSDPFYEYKGIQVFIPANISKTKDDLYCSCGGPTKENCVLGKKFYVCSVCKKEVI